MRTLSWGSNTLQNRSIIKGKGMLSMSKEHFVISHDMEVKESCITLVPYKAKFIQGVWSLLLKFNDYQCVPAFIKEELGALPLVWGISDFHILEKFKGQALESPSISTKLTIALNLRWLLVDRVLA